MIDSIPLTSFTASNDNARTGRRNALSNKLDAAANAAGAGHYRQAIDILRSVPQKLDGEENPPDWMNDPERTLLAHEVMLLISLLEILV